MGIHFAHAEKLNIASLHVPVEDRGQMFSSQLQRWLNQELLRLYNEGGPQIQVLTLPTLEGNSIEEVAIQVMDQEKIGRKGKDDGILLIFSNADHKMRIEVGRGLEGDLPDVNAKRILADTIRPYFKNKQMDRGLIEGLIQITSQVAPNFAFTGIQQQPRQNHEYSDNSHFFDEHPLLLLIILIVLIFFFRGGGPFIFGGGGGGWSGGSGGGGWSGGGGSSAGGGSSSDW